MNCELTEKVSLLIDAELAPDEAAQLRAHIDGCAACKQSLEAFLLLRQDLRSYDWTPDPHAQSEALASILASRAPDAEAGAPSVSARRDGLPTSRGLAQRLRERLREAFVGRHLQPAYIATLTLLLVVGLLGIRRFMDSSNFSRTPAPHPGASQVARTNPPPAQSVAGAEFEGDKLKGLSAADESVINQAKTPKPPRSMRVAVNLRAGRDAVRARRDTYKTEHQRRESLSREFREEMARAATPVSPPSPANAVAFEATGGRWERVADPTLRIGRHAEQVEMLLRSFRNARLTESDPTLDVADARRLSKRLLYNNIALRREAASMGNLPVEGLLDSLEPTLLDISNLPDKPSPETLSSIKERIRKRQLVGVLQAQVMLASR